MPRRPFWIAQLSGWTLYALILWLSMLPLLTGAPLSVAFDHLRMKGLMASTGLLTSLLLFALYERLLARRAALCWLVSAAVGASLAAGLLWTVLVRVLDRPGAPFTPEVWKGASNYGITLLAWSALYLTFAVDRQREAERERALRATALATEAQLQMLRYQVNPHFLFNALNSIRALIDEDSRRARDMVTELAELFRYSLRSAREADVPFGEELAAIESYLAIQKIRFEEKLDVSIDVPAAAKGVRLPGFLIHPLVENAVKYGMETSAMPLRVELTASLANDVLRVEVSNTGRWKPAGGERAGGTGTGLANIRGRLAQLFPDRHRLEVGEADGKVRAVLEVTLPASVSSGEAAALPSPPLAGRLEEAV